MQQNGEVLSNGGLKMSEGLEGVIAAETVLSEVDGEAGRLVIRGCSLDQLSGRVPYEAVVHLLFEGFFDDLPDVRALTIALGQARVEVFAQVAARDADLRRLTTVE